MVLAQAPAPTGLDELDDIDKLEKALDALGISEDDAFNFAIGVDQELLNPSTPVDGLSDYHTLNDVFFQHLA